MSNWEKIKDNVGKFSRGLAIGSGIKGVSAAGKAVRKIVKSVLKGMKAGQAAKTAMKMSLRPIRKGDLDLTLAKRKLLKKKEPTLKVSSSPVSGGSNYNPQQ